MNIILFGPPGSGKGTQSKFIADFYHLKLISLGYILRKYYFKNHKIRKKLSFGNLISNTIITNIVKDYIINNNTKNGYLFDGFPRNIIQAKSLNFININYVIELYMCNNMILSRLLGRRIHLNSGRIYHVLYKPPHLYGVDDITGEKLVSRDDDTNISVIKKRLSIYYYELIGLRFYYKQFFNKKKTNGYYRINAENNIDYVKNNIFKILG